MRTYRFTFSANAGFSIKCNRDWPDTTEQLDTESKPYTLTKATGVEALQFSAALYQYGQEPLPTEAYLLSMAQELGRRLRLGKPIHSSSKRHRLTQALVDYKSKGDFFRIWYVTDGKNLMLVTYVCNWKDRDIEVPECEAIVESIRFE